jgi:hypothetical protein
MGFIGQSISAKVSGSDKAPKEAARIQADSAREAIAEDRRQFDITRQDQQPWLQAGQGALARLQDPNAFQADPGYNFQRTEGMRGIERSFAARGGAASGNALRALAEFNNGLAAQSYGNWWNRQAGLAGVGQSSAQNLGALGSQFSSRIGNNLQNAGDARASGIVNQAANRQQMIQNGQQNAQQWFGWGMGGGWGGGR